MSSCPLFGGGGNEEKFGAFLTDCDCCRQHGSRINESCSGISVREWHQDLSPPVLRRLSFQGYGDIYARVDSLVKYTNSSTVTTVYNTDQWWLRSSINWETGAQYSYDYAFSGDYCEHV